MATFRIANGAAAAKELPARLKLLAWGENASTKGSVRVGALTLSSLPRAQAAHGFARVALDYEHNTVPGTPAFAQEKEPRKVAAYGVPEVVANEGLFLTDLVWTPSGRENAKEFFDLSPAVQLEAGEVCFMHSAALCRQGAVEGLTFYSITLPDGAKPGDDHMTITIEALSARIEALEKKGPDTTKLEALSGTVTALSTRLEKAEGEVVRLNGEIVRRDRQAIQERAAREGKEIPLSQAEIDQTPVATLSAMVDKLKPTVPLKAKSPDRDPEFTAHAADEDAAAESARAARIRTLAAEIQTREGVSFSTAWSRASAQVGKAAPKKG